MNKTWLAVGLTCAVAAVGCGRMPAPQAGSGVALAASASAAGPEMTFVANQDYMPAVEKLLARPGIRSVDVLQFSFAVKPGATRRIFDQLAKLQASGVKVRVLMEGVAGTKDENQKTAALLQAAGIEAVKLSAEHTTHAKAICVDGEALLMGSTNWTVTSIERNNETNALIRSPRLGQAFTRWYDRMWAGHEAMAEGATTDGDTTLFRDTAFYAEAEAMIDSAERSLDIATYFLAYRANNARDAKVEALLKRIVDRAKALKAKGKPLSVRLFIDNNGISPERQKSHTLEAACHAKAYMAKHGLTDVHFDSARQISHMKYILKDAGTAGAEVLFGSTNWYWADLDHHHQLNVRTSDPALVKRFADYQAARIAQAEPSPCD
ncbi:MAG: phospholipase D-like domain-containing protein [Candidatus Sericytochromatia bacterium]